MTEHDPERLPGWLLTVGLGIAVAGVVIQSIAYLLQEFVLTSVVFLGADSEANAYAWAGSVATFGAAFAVLVLYGLLRQVGLLVLALILTYFSLDDVATLHERLARRAEDSFGLPEDSWRAIWIFAYVPLLLVTVVLLIAVARSAIPRVRRFILAGLGLLGLALAAEASTALSLGGLTDGHAFDAIETAVRGRSGARRLDFGRRGAHGAHGVGPDHRSNTGKTGQPARSTVKGGGDQLPQRGDGTCPGPQTVSTYDRGPRCGGGNGREIGDGVSGDPVFI